MGIVSDTITILFIADIVGKPGIQTVELFLSALKKKYRVDLTIANGENALRGMGISDEIARQLLGLGIDLLTGGNHIWSNHSYRVFLDTSDRVLRPLNYPDSVPGKGSTLFKTKSGLSVGVMNLQGRTFMQPIDCPFVAADMEIQRLAQYTPIIFVDFHAEATAEKIALGHFLDGKISALVGTHTHVQTADEKILAHGTAYITDVGMTGPQDSVIGMDKQVAIKRFMTSLPEKYHLASGDNHLNAVVLKIDSKTGIAKSIERINLP